MKCAIIVAALLLAGCSGPNTNELLTEAPTRIVETSMAPEAVRDCIVALDPAHFIPTPKGAGWLIISTLQGFNEQAFFTTVIIPTATGSRVEDHRGHSPLVGTMPDMTGKCLDALPKV